MKEALFSCFGGVEVEEYDNCDYVKFKDFEALAEKCTRYIDGYEAEHLKYLELKEKFENSDSKRILELEETNDELKNDKENGERVCQNLQDALIQAREKIAEEEKEKGRLRHRINELNKQICLLSSDLAQKGVKICSKFDDDELCVTELEEPRKYNNTYYFDFSEHDKQLNEKVADLKSKLMVAEKGRTEWMEKAVEWQNKYEKLDWERQELPFEPMEVAQMLINATFEYETSEIQRRFLGAGDKGTCERYDIDQLEQIAEHLLIYCKHNKEVEE